MSETVKIISKENKLLEYEESEWLKKIQEDLKNKTEVFIGLMPLDDSFEDIKAYMDRLNMLGKKINCLLVSGSKGYCHYLYFMKRKEE